MSTHIVVACDPGRNAREALEAAAQLADPDDPVTIVHVVNPLEQPWQDRERHLADAVAVVAARRRDEIAALLRELGLEAAVVVEPLRSGEESAPALARIAEGLGADVLVVVSKRASGLRGMLLGSVAQGLLTLSPCPVLVVRAPLHPPPGDEGREAHARGG